MDGATIAVLISASAAAITGLVAQIQHSRCTSVSCCCVTCERNVPPDATPTPAPLTSVAAS